MSHFTVLVVGEDIEGQMERFYEQGEPDDYFMEFQAEYNSTEEAKADMESHNTKTMLIPETERQSWEVVYDTVEEYLQDHHGFTSSNKDGAYGYYSNPEAKWDWWVTGGRWSGFLKSKPGAEYGEKRCDSLEVGDLDIKGLEEIEKRKAEREYYLLRKVTKGIIAPKGWDEFRKDFEDIKEAREKFRADPFIKAYNEATAKEEYSDLPSFWYSDVVTHFKIGNGGEEAYIKEQVEACFTTFALLHEDEWHEQGHMGWFGMSDDHKGNWNSKFRDIIRSLDPEELITVVDCHI